MISLLPSSFVLRPSSFILRSSHLYNFPYAFFLSPAFIIFFRLLLSLFFIVFPLVLFLSSFHSVSVLLYHLLSTLLSLHLFITQHKISGINNEVNFKPLK